MSEYRFAISLRLFHPSRPLSDVTTTLGIEPKYFGLAGAPRISPGGRALGVYREHYWSARLWNGNSRECDLPTALVAVLDRLEPSRSFLVDLAAEGVRSEFFLGWFFDEGNSGDVLTHGLLARLAEFRIDLSFDVYPEIQSTLDGQLGTESGSEA